MNEKLKTQASQVINNVKQQRSLLYALLAAVVLLLGLLAYCGTSGRHGSGRDLPVGEAFDSLTAVLPKGSVVVGRFPDADRADLYYMNSGVLYCFNGKSKLLEEMTIAGVPSGSFVDAKLSQDEKYIMLTVREGKLNKLYRLNTMNRNIVDMEQSTVVADDTEEVEEKVVRPVEKLPEVPQIDEPLPEAAFADEPTGAGHEVKKEQPEPKKQAEPTNAPEVTTISTE